MPDSKQPVPGLSATGYSSVRAFSLFSFCILFGALFASLKFAPPLALIFALIPLLMRPIFLWPLRVASLLSCAFAFSFIFSSMRISQCGPKADDLCFAPAGHVRFTGRVDECKGSGTIIVLPEQLLSPEVHELNGKVMVDIDGDLEREYVPGNLIEISGFVHSPKERKFSFEFDEAGWLARKGIYSRVTARAASLKLVDSGDCSNSKSAIASDCIFSISRTVAMLRSHIVATHNRNLGPVSGSLFSSMVMGDKVVAIDKQLKSEFARIGLSHLLAASGLNLTIIVGAALVFCHYLGTNRLATWLSFTCVVLFTTFAGAGPSVSRAAVMCLIALWARLSFVRLANGSALALALMIALACDPSSILDVGLQLSYGATFGIIYIYPLIKDAWLDAIKNKIAGTVASLTAVVMAAQFAVLPVQLGVFEQLSLLVVPANLMAEPVVVPLTIIGFISSIFACASLILTQCSGSTALLSLMAGCCSAISFGLDWLAQFLLAWLIQCAHTLSAIPLASMTVARPQAVHVIAYYLVMALALVYGRAKAKVACSILLVAMFLLCAISYIESPLLEIFCTKNAVVIAQNNGSYVVWFAPVDDGKTSNLSGSAGYLRYLKNRGMTEAKLPVNTLLSARLPLLSSGICLNRQKSLGASHLPALSIESLSPALQNASGFIIYCPSRPDASGHSQCIVSGTVTTPFWLPHCPNPMPIALPLFADCQSAKSAYYVRFRL